METVAVIAWGTVSVVSMVLALLLAVVIDKDGPRRLALWMFLMSMGSASAAAIVLFAID
jgi:hypothetical protein